MELPGSWRKAEVAVNKIGLQKGVKVEAYGFT